MQEKTKKQLSFLIGLATIVVVLALYYVFFKYLFPFAAPFLISFLFAVILQKPLRFLDKKTNKKCHGLLSVLLVLVCIALVLVPIILILANVGREIADFARYLMGQMSDFPAFLATLQNEILNLLKFLPDQVYNSVSETITNFFAGLSNDFDLSKFGLNGNSITSGVSGVVSVVKNVPSILLSLVIGIIAWIFFTKDYNYIVGFIKRQLPDGKKNILVEIKQVFTHTILKMFRAYGIIMLITFCELSLGLGILSAMNLVSKNYIFVIALAIAVFDILPVAGSGGILIPWALISAVMGDFSRCVGLLIIYVVISVIRQYIEPKIVGGTLGVNPIITLAGLYFGLKLFGFMGMFIVPLTIVTLKAFNDTGRLHLWKNE